jgi:hypothetical protein
MGERTILLLLFGTPLIVALPHGVKLTALGLEAEGDSFRLWFGLALLLGGTIGLECVSRCVALLSAEARAAGVPARSEGNPRAAERSLRAARVLHVLLVVSLQLITLLLFVLLLDGHVRLRACLWLYLAYVAGVVLVLAGRKVSTGWGSRYLCWGWAPMIACGVPLFLPTLKAAGLVPFSPLSW